MIGKSRVAPVKVVTIPRLELTAAVIAVKLHQFVKEEIDLDIHQSFFWTDSQVVLRYLLNTSSRFKVFVANRVQTVQDLSNVQDWYYVPSKLNPADLASRGIQTNETDKLQYWLNGPEFLREMEYPKFDKVREDDDELEVKRVLACEVSEHDFSYFLHYFSSFAKLLRSVVWLTRFLQFLATKTKTHDKQISVEENKNAEMKIIQGVQKEKFEVEIQDIKTGQQAKTSSTLASLCPIFEDGLLKVGGRQPGTHPVILPKHHVTDLIIKQVHEQNGHVGLEHCRAKLNQNYYILQAYSNVKRVINSCLQCKMQTKMPLQQQMAPLPPESLMAGDPPFTNVGVDYFGPFNVKHGRGTTKRWGCLFTCLLTRAVHIEIAHSLSSDSFLHAFHRFTARRGKPSKVWSDNATNFTAADKELHGQLASMNQHQVEEDMLVEAIEWKFIPPHTPHQGGVWERLVRSVKRILKSLINDKLLTDEELTSYLCEVERILNDRPLTRISDDPRDSGTLTPNHLLLLRRNSCQPTSTCENATRRRWEIVQELANQFFKRFCSEYLPLQQERSKWRRIKENLQEGDIVLVVKESHSRGKWPLGKVTAVNKGRDGLVRSATIKYNNKSKIKSINQLILLEKSGEEE